MVPLDDDEKSEVVDEIVKKQDEECKFISLSEASEKMKRDAEE